MSEGDNPGGLAHHFESLEQQHYAASLGMWIFIATEVMFFGGIFAGYTIYRFLYWQAFHDASHHLDAVLGAINTGVLLTSSLTMALSVEAVRHGNRKRAIWLLLATALLGSFFLGIKGLEYFHKFQEHLVPGRGFHWETNSAPQAQIFFWLYFIATGLHGLHVLIGIGIMTVLAVLTWRGHVNKERFMPVEISGLYWHFVDIVWVFLFPLFYLVGIRG